MKTRNGFVSNSSSSSFILKKHHLNTLQLMAIRDHINFAQKLGLYANEEDAWSVDENDYTVKLHTWMNNFDMYEFLEMIDVSKEAIHKYK